MKKDKVLFLIPDGIGIRNYLYSDVIKYLKQNNAEIAFWSTLPKEAFAEVNLLHNIKNLDYKKIDLKPENALTRIFRESATYARLIYNANKVNNETILGNWRKGGKSFKQTQLYNLAEKIGNWASKKYSRILWLENKSIKYWDKSIIESYKKDLKQLNPTSIFITHQRVASLNPICIAAKELGITVITAIYSWDNLPKARLAVIADKYLMWSDYMKDEMKIYHPEISQENVIVTGTPQFEFYNKNENIISREEFAKKYNLDINKKWICFSGDDKTSSPNDPLYLKDIIQALANKEIQIIFRRCPADFSDRYDKVIKEFSDNLIIIDPEWHTTNLGWNSFFAKLSDVKLLVNITFHCDLVINVGSTMAHDFAVYNKPCLYLKYNKNENLKWRTEWVYRFQHLRSMEGLAAVGWLNNKEEILHKILLALNSPELVGPDRKKWLEKIVQHPIEDSSKNIAQILLNTN